MLPNLIKIISEHKDRPTHEELAAANNEILRLKVQVEYYKSMEYIKQGKEELEKQFKCFEQKISDLKKEEWDLRRRMEGIQVSISDTQIENCLKTFGFIESEYDFETSKEYENKFREIKEEQREIMKNKNAIYCFDKGESLNKNETSISPLILDIIKQLLLSAFNSACYEAISNVTDSPANHILQRKKIHNITEYLNSLVLPVRCLLKGEYENLKFAELYTFHTAQRKKFEEALGQREIKEKLEHQKHVRSEIKEEFEAAVVREKEIEKNLQIARQQVSTNNSTELKLEIKQLEIELKEAVNEKKDLKVRTQMLTAGHVYVASNAGSFGDNVCVIGMTIELKPAEYIKNLGNESVPFPFELHALILSENAVELKNKLHEKFSHQRVNQVNENKDFFNVSLNEVKLAIKDIMAKDKTAKAKMKFIPVQKAKEYYKSLEKIRNNRE